MVLEIDEIDRKLLTELQRDGTLSVDQLSERVALSRNACWRRVKRLEEDGVITGRVALVDAEKLGLGLSVFVLIRTSNHDPDWLQKFRAAVTGFPEITGVYRMSGDLDYRAPSVNFSASIPNITVASVYELYSHRAWSSSCCSTIHP